MTDDTQPGRGATDLELAQRWRAEFNEQPSDAVDARIRSAARGVGVVAPGPRAQPAVSRAGRRWIRVAPLAAAASVALIAVGLVRLIPREEYAAMPASPSVQAETVAPSVLAPLPAGPSADAEFQSAPVFVPDAPPVAAMLPEERASPSPDRPAGDTAAALADAAPARRAESPAVRETARAAPSQDSLGAGALLQSPPTASATRAQSHDSAAKAADARATQPTSAALADAARRFGVDVDDLRVIEVTPVTWSDASLGCGASEAAGAHAAGVPGYIIAVQSGGEVLRYHTDADAKVRLCE